jgi:hypothetical protein
MEQELKLVIILESPPPGVDFGLQKGSGNDYETIQTQRSKSGDLRFEFEVRVREGKDGQPNFLGPFAQGSAQQRFVYIDIGTYAGQKNTPCLAGLRFHCVALRGIKSRRPKFWKPEFQVLVETADQAARP